VQYIYSVCDVSPVECTESVNIPLFDSLYFIIQLYIMYNSRWFWWGNLRERDHWGDQDVVERIILRWTFGKWEGVVGTGWSWLRIGTDGGHL